MSRNYRFAALALAVFVAVALTWISLSNKDSSFENKASEAVADDLEQSSEISDTGDRETRVDTPSSSDQAVRAPDAPSAARVNDPTSVPRDPSVLFSDPHDFGVEYLDARTVVAEHTGSGPGRLANLESRIVLVHPDAVRELFQSAQVAPDRMEGMFELPLGNGVSCELSSVSVDEALSENYQKIDAECAQLESQVNGTYVKDTGRPIFEVVLSPSDVHRLGRRYVLVPIPDNRFSHLYEVDIQTSRYNSLLYRQSRPYRAH